MAFQAARNVEDLARRMGTPDIDVREILTRPQEPSPTDSGLAFVIAYQWNHAAGPVAWDLLTSIRIAYFKQTYSANLAVCNKGDKAYVTHGENPPPNPNANPIFEIITGGNSADGRSFSSPLVYVEVRNLKPRTETYDLELILQAYAARLEAHAMQLEEKRKEYFASMHV